MPVFRGVRRWGFILSALLLTSLFISACGGNPPSIINPSGPVALQESNLFWFILVVATLVFVAVEGVLIYSIIRYRERPNTPAPRQIHGNTRIEIVWTIAPSIFLFAVLIGTIYTMFGLAQPAGRKLEVQAIGHQWWWEFKYVNENITTADELEVPIGTVVQVDLISKNVIHSFWVPELTGKTDVVPGHTNVKWFQADKAGYYRGECTEYCGAQHANMEFYVRAVEPATFNTWVSGQQQAAQASSDPAAVAGQKLFAGGGGCVACHGIVGVNLKSFSDPAGNGLVGPNLTHFGSRRQIAGGVLPWDPVTCQIVTDSSGKPAVKDKAACNLYKWLQDPQGVKPGNDMNISQLTDTQIAQLIAYLESLQ